MYFNQHNKLMITTKQFYLAPQIEELDINTEGILCESNPSGAGNLNDNAWDLTFGETIN